MGCEGVGGGRVWCDGVGEGGGVDGGGQGCGVTGGGGRGGV